MENRFSGWFMLVLCIVIYININIKYVIQSVISYLSLRKKKKRLFKYTENFTSKY